MAWWSIDIELKVLIVHQKATTLLKDGKMSVVLLGQHVQVVALCQLSLDLNRLSMDMWTTYCLDETKNNLKKINSLKGFQLTVSSLTSNVHSVHVYANEFELVVRSSAGNGVQHQSLETRGIDRRVMDQ